MSYPLDLFPSVRAARLLPAAGLLLALAGCQLVGPAPPPATGSITYVVTGGFSGGLHTRLSVDLYGLVTEAQAEPPQQYQLPADEHEALLGLFAGFFTMPEPSQEEICADDVYFQVTFRSEGRERTVGVSGCTLMYAGDSLSRLHRIVEALGALSQHDAAPHVARTGAGAARR